MAKPAFFACLAKRPRAWLIATPALCCALWASAEELPEYQIKAGFLYNFVTFTEWPADVGEILNLCVYGHDPFGHHLDELQGKTAGHRHLVVRRVSDLNRLTDCQIVFIARSDSDNQHQVLGRLSGKPVLTIADTPRATHRGVVLNMITRQNRVTFEVNLAAARGNGLNVSAKLLRLAWEVIQ